MQSVNHGVRETGEAVPSPDFDSFDGISRAEAIRRILAASKAQAQQKPASLVRRLAELAGVA